MKILLSAYACEPNRGTEPGVGWNTAVALAQHHPIWVFTSNTHRAAIEAELAVRPIENLQVVYLDPFGWVYDWSQEGKKAHWDVHLHYYLWQIWAYFVGRSLHQSIGFDLVHHLTYGKYSAPCFLSFLPVPFFWGPIGGAESAPQPFWQDFSLRARTYEVVRSLSQQVGELDPFVRLTARRSLLTWCKAEDTAKRMRALGAQHVSVMVESGLRPEEIATLANYPIPTPEPIRFISMGRLLHWKGFYLGVRAFAQAALPNAEYWILGEGPERDRLQTLAEELGIAHQVKFWGNLPRNEGLAKLGECHVLVHPSLHDSGGWVCLEGMAAGRPVLCLDLGGPGIQVTTKTGFKIAAHNPEQAIQGLAEAMTRLARDPDLRVQMGQAGQRLIASSYNWQAKGKALTQAYEEVITPLGSKLNNPRLINDQFVGEGSPK
jgi:glycosyltransferase involved in cell wall biosynthesis